jgi:hypothetical protein
MLGQPVSSATRGIGETEEIPDGGETRIYRTGEYRININFDKQSVARGLQIEDGLHDASYSLEQWPVVLSRLGVSVLAPPDIVAPAARSWKNYLGYGISVFADTSNGTVWSVRIFKR